MPEAATKLPRWRRPAPISLRSANGYGCRTRSQPPPSRPPPRFSLIQPRTADWTTEMPRHVSAHSRDSGNPASGAPPEFTPDSDRGRGRAGIVGVGAATIFFAASLPLLSLRPAAAAEPDLAFGAFQTGHYLTAFGIATNRVELRKDPKSMTLLGELYAGGLGVPQNDAKAAEWYQFAAARGDREAMFALAMFRLRGRAGPRDRDAAAKWLAAAAKLGHPLAAYNLALLYIEGQLFPQDFNRAAELMREAADAASPEAQYALGTFYKQGRGVPKDPREAARLWALAALADNIDAQVEYAIALFNGDGVAKNEQAAAALFRRAAVRGN